jgi:RNA polymerase primary sigma factor
MITYDPQKNEIFWHGLLNRKEARVLSSTEERKLLVELDHCKQRILKAMTQSNGSVLDESLLQTDFHQLVRDLAGTEQIRLDPPAEAIKPLARRYKEIRARLAMANVRLVAHVAKRYQDRGIPPGDLIQEGFCALLVAIDRFDLVNETRLATYAIWWIRQAIQRAVACGAYPVRLNPRHLHQLARAQERASDRDRDRLTRSDSPRQIFAPTIERVFAATRPVISLNAPSRSDDTVTIGELVIPHTDEDSQADDAQQSVGELIRALSSREQLVLNLRFGLADESPMTLVEVSRVLGVSKERVRQIQDRALQRLRTAAARAKPDRPLVNESLSQSSSKKKG